jgi:hypothetical protein
VLDEALLQQSLRRRHKLNSCGDRDHRALAVAVASNGGGRWLASGGLKSSLNVHVPDSLDRTRCV